MALRLLAALNAHPSFLRAAGDPAQTHPNGAGVGDVYAFETNSTDLRKMVYEPGETTVVYYVTSAASGWTAAEIEAAESLSGGTVDAAWIVNQTTTDYGLRSDKPIDWDDLGRGVSSREQCNNENPQRKAVWMRFEAGGSYGGLYLFDNFSLYLGRGESPLHPSVYNAFGSGAAPQMTERNLRNSGPGAENVVFDGLHWTGFTESCHSIQVAATNIAFIDCKTDAGELFTSGTADKDRITVYGTDIWDVRYDVPDNGTTWNARDDRISGAYPSKINGLLFWRCFLDYNSWEEGFNSDGVTYSGGTFPQPPSFFSHNIYCSEFNYDCTFNEILSARAAGTAFQGRSGGLWTNVVMVENGEGGPLGVGALYIEVDNSTLSGTFSSEETITVETSQGDIVTQAGRDGPYAQHFIVEGDSAYYMKFISIIEKEDLDKIQAGDIIRSAAGATVQIASPLNVKKWGNYSFAHTCLTMGARYGATSDGFSPQFGRGQVALGFGCSAKEYIQANGADPNNSSEVTAKSAGIPINSEGLDQFSTAYKFEYRLINWLGETDVNDSTTGSDADNITLGAWYDIDQSQAVGTTTTQGALEAIRAAGNGATLAKTLWNHAAARTGDTQIGHTAGATVRFVPDPDADGFRADYRGNWRANGGPDSLVNKADYPVDGDNVDLDGRLVYSYLTLRLADLDFGLGGGLRLYGGLISCTSSQAGSRGSVELKNAAKFRIASGTHTAQYDVTADNGRYEVDGTVSSGVSGTFSGQSQCIVYGGGSLTIASGETFTFTGGDLRAGFDDDSAGTATLTVASGGTLAFVAASGALPEIREVRTGRFGFEAPATGHTGQPKDPSVVSTVVLASGSTVTVDTTGMSAGTYDLIDVDSLTDSGATLPAGVAVVGSKLQVTVS